MVIYTLPDSTIIFNALVSAMDEGYAREKIYPYIANCLANKELILPGIELGISMAIVTRCNELGLPNVATKALMMSSDVFTEKICEVSKITEE